MMKWRSWDLNLKTRLFGETLFNIMFWMYFPFITLYFSGVFGKHVAGMMMTVPPLMGAVGNLVGGHLSDRLGRRPVMLIGAFIQVGMFVLFSLSVSHWVDYIAYIGIGLGGALYGPASAAMVADLTPEKDRRMVFAIFIAAVNIGAVFGPALGAIFFFNYRSELLWTCTLVTLSYAVAILFLIRETLPESTQTMKRDKTLTAVLREQGHSYGIIFSDKVFSMYILAGIMVTIAFMQLDMYLAVYLKEFVPDQALLPWNDWSFVLTDMEIFGWMIGISGLLIVFLLLPVTKWTEHWRDRDALIISALLFGLGMFLVGLTTNVWLLFGLTVIFTCGEIICAPVVRSFVSKYAPESERGLYMGASNLQYTVARLMAPVTIVMSEWVAPIGVFGFILLCTLTGAILYAKLFRYIPDQNND